MKYLGEGYYYRVYELKNGRVFKKFQPYWFSFKKIYSYNIKNKQTFLKALVGTHKARLQEVKALRTIKQKLEKIPSQIFASPKFISGLDYSQDKVRVIADWLDKNNFTENKKIIDQYIEFQKTLWSYQMHDKTYKFQANYGLNQNGQLVCLDFGEFAYKKEDAIKSIQGKKWLTRATYKNWDDKALKDYYTKQMEDLMTESALDSCWGILPSLQYSTF